MSILKRYGYWIHSTKFTALTKFSNLFVNLLSFILLTRILTPAPAAFGVWALFTTIFATVETARISFMRNAFIRHVNQADDTEHQNLQAAAFVISIFISVFLAACFIVLAPVVRDGLNAPGLDIMLRWCALTILISTISSQCEMSLTAKSNFRAVSFMHLFRQLSFLAVISFYWIAGLKLTPTSLSIYHLLSIALSTFVALNQAKSILKLSFKNYRMWMPKLWHYGKYIFGTNIAAQAFRSIDTFLSAALFSPSISALYSAGNRISNLIDMPSQVLADVAFNKASRMDNNDRTAVRNMYEKTTGAILIFSLPALLIILFFPELVLRVLVGKAFLDAVPILRITAFFGFVLPFLKQYGTIMDATGFPQINFRTNLLAFVLNFVFCYIGLTMFGYLGAAIGTALTYTCIFFTTQWILHKKFGIQVWMAFVNMGRFYGILYNAAKEHGLRFFSLRKAGRSL